MAATGNPVQLHSPAPDDQHPGHRLVTEGKLRDLRNRLGLSVTMQSHMIGVQPAALRAWEAGTTMPSSPSCQKVLTWYEQAMDALDRPDVDSADLVHVSVASQYLARSYASIRAMCESGAIRCVDLGPLGLFVAREELAEPNR